MKNLNQNPIKIIGIKKGNKSLKGNDLKKGIEKINLKSLSDRINRMEYSERSNNSGGNDRSEYIYNYPPEINDKYKRNGIEGKNFRSGLRKKLIHFSEIIGLYSQKKRIPEMKEKLKEFFSFYKENYRENNFSENQYSNLKGDNKEMKIEKIKILFEISKKNLDLMESGKKKSIPKKSSPSPKKNPIKKGIRKDKGLIEKKEIIENKEDNKEIGG